jgi:hypothetical protein
MNDGRYLNQTTNMSLLARWSRNVADVRINRQEEERQVELDMQSRSSELRGMTDGRNRSEDLFNGNDSGAI